MVSPLRGASPWTRIVAVALALVMLVGIAQASVGDRLPEFKDCVDVRPPSTNTKSNLLIPLQVCISHNCGHHARTSIRTLASLISTPLPLRPY